MPDKVPGMSWKSKMNTPIFGNLHDISQYQRITGTIRIESILAKQNTKHVQIMQRV